MFDLAYEYFAYGLHIVSELQLPELVTKPSPVNNRADLVIRVNWDENAEQNDLTNSIHIDCDVTVLNSPETGCFVIRAGREIEIRPNLRTNNDTLRAFLLGPALAIALYQRGSLVLHGSSVALHQDHRPQNAVGFLGHSGQGKSTLAAVFHQRGHRVIGDDIIAIPIEPTSKNTGAAERTVAPMIFPAYPQLRLWPQSVSAVGQNPEELPLLYPGQQRRVQQTRGSFLSAALPLHRLYILQDGDTLQIEKLSSSQSLIELIQRCYLTSWLQGRDMGYQLQQCAALISRVSVRRLQRPRDLTLLSQIAQLIENDMSDDK